MHTSGNSGETAYIIDFQFGIFTYNNETRSEGRQEHIEYLMDKEACNTIHY